MNNSPDWTEPLIKSADTPHLTPEELNAEDAALRAWKKPGTYPYTSPTKAFRAGYRAARDAAVARVRELEADVAIVDFLATYWNSQGKGHHLAGHWFPNVNGSFRSAIHSEKESIAAARAAGTGEEGGMA